MSQISHKQARSMLRQACIRYINHKEGQLNKLIGESLYKPDHVSFIEVLGEDAPEPGFNDWVLCNYYFFLKNIFRMSSTLGYGRYLSGELYIETEDGTRQPLKPMKLYGRFQENLEHNDPDLVLYNLEVLVEILHLFMSKNHRDWAEIKKNKNLQESDYAYSDDAPCSLKISQTLKHFHALLTLIETLPNYQSNLDLFVINARLGRAMPVFDSYLKKLATQELKDILENASLDDNEALEQVEFQLKNPSTLALLNKNNQSASEQNLKLLSVIGILIVAGIFTTLALMAKRLYDSGGTSINFFKPLSTNLREDLEHITQSTKLLK
ncbi:hypothetical protein [Legionella saoudiensis]|uniref:hypothetical protein n=1 Tax=Legionella saoudiensis TaxID=1750561 RepID=UPI00073061C6|nr:hypothetical protein [Legionella saoudiensis]